jgi:Holliday junction resolvase-like predicted endonuclease
MPTQTALDLDIEVTVREGDSSTQRGALLEVLAKRVLVSLQHDHVSTNVRVTGCELDVIATERQTGAKVLVECKAYRDRSISAEVLTKMLGNLVVHDYQAAWLITTAKLGKDAAGIVDSLREKGYETRQKLRVYEPTELINLLISTNYVVDPAQLELSPTFKPCRTGHY